MISAITKKMLIDNVAKKWRKQHFGFLNPKHKNILSKLEELKPKMEDEVAAIIGNRSWTNNECHECSKNVDILIKFCNDLDENDEESHYCLVCLERAVKIGKSYE